MNINEVIARINELAKKNKAEGLTPEELTERDKLRRIYIDNVKASLVGQLDNTYIVEPDGTKRKLSKKESTKRRTKRYGSKFYRLYRCLMHSRQAFLPLYSAKPRELPQKTQVDSCLRKTMRSPSR